MKPGAVRRLLRLAVLAPLLASCQTTTQGSNSLPGIELRLDSHVIHAEVAASTAARMHGLMGRRQLPAHSGMLFVFPDPPQRICMWMKNTLIPLSVAFMDERGRILNVEEMSPLSLQTHCAYVPARYALEMNAGWFAAHGGTAGTRISGLANAPQAE